MMYFKVQYDAKLFHSHSIAYGSSVEDWIETGEDRKCPPPGDMGSVLYKYVIHIPRII